MVQSFHWNWYMCLKCMKCSSVLAHRKQLSKVITRNSFGLIKIPVTLFYLRLLVHVFILYKYRMSVFETFPCFLPYLFKKREHVFFYFSHAFHLFPHIIINSLDHISSLFSNSSHTSLYIIFVTCDFCHTLHVFPFVFAEIVLLGICNCTIHC
jgi:hypothetical protein